MAEKDAFKAFLEARHTAPDRVLIGVRLQGPDTLLNLEYVECAWGYRVFDTESELAVRVVARVLPAAEQMKRQQCQRRSDRHAGARVALDSVSATLAEVLPLASTASELWRTFD